MKKICNSLVMLVLVTCFVNEKSIKICNESRIPTYVDLSTDNSLSLYNSKYYNDKAFQSNDSVTRYQIYLSSKSDRETKNWKSFRKKSLLLKSEAIKHKDILNIVRAYNNLSEYYRNEYKTDSSFFYLIKAQKAAFFLKDKKYLAEIYYNQALLYSDVSNYISSDFMAIKALRLFDSIKCISGKWDVFNILAINSFGIKDYENAIKYNKQALKISVDNNLKLNEISLNNIGNNYAEMQKHNKAIEYYQKALRTQSLYITHPSLYATLLTNLAYSRLMLNETKNIDKLFFKSLKIRDSLKLSSKIVYSNTVLSQYYYKIKDVKKAIKFAVEAMDLANTTKVPYDLLISLTQLIKVDPKNALKYSQEYIRISDSMQQLERETRNKFAKIAYETDEIIKEKESAEKKNRIISATASGLILVLVLLLIIIVQRTKQKRLELEQVQQKANEEIYNLLLDKQNKIDRGRKIEKKRIAQDLHDSVLNRLASTRLNLHNIAENPDAEKLQKCLPFIDGIQDIEKEIRNIAHDLNRGAFSNAISFLEVIESFIEEQQTLSNRKQHLEIDPTIDWELLSSNKKIHIFRILQEAFQNINKHSGAKSVMVSLLKRDEHILLEIFDDGDGFSFNEKKKGIGLQNIFSRAHSCGGSAQVKSRVHEGTTVIVKIPL